MATEISSLAILGFQYCLPTMSIQQYVVLSVISPFEAGHFHVALPLVLSPSSIFLYSWTFHSSLLLLFF